MRQRASEAVANRERFATRLREHGFEPMPSAANFLMVPVTDAIAIAQFMREQGVAIRPYPQLPGIGDALRITIGPWPLMDVAFTSLLAARTAVGSGVSTVPREPRR